MLLFFKLWGQCDSTSAHGVKIKKIHINNETGCVFFMTDRREASVLNYLHDKIVRLPTFTSLSQNVYSRGIT